MSSFKRETKHPKTGLWENAEWLDDYFGNHHYGVRFSDGRVFNPEDIELVTRQLNEVMTKDEQLALIREKCVAANPTILEDIKYCGFGDESDKANCKDCFRFYRPIRLADVLLAIGQLFSLRGRMNAATEELLKLYNLRADDLTQQSDETITFLADLLK